MPHQEDKRCLDRTSEQLNRTINETKNLLEVILDTDESLEKYEEFFKDMNEGLGRILIAINKAKDVRKWITEMPSDQSLFR